MKRRILILSLSYILFGICLSIGFFIARHKPLWGDEVFSQRNIIQRMSYGDMLKGKIGQGEGNASPLFYLLQKALI